MITPSWALVALLLLDELLYQCQRSILRVSFDLLLAFAFHGNRGHDM